MIYFKLRYKTLGIHTHARVFSSPTREGIYSYNGPLIFRHEEWEEFRRQFKDAVVLPEEDEELRPL